MRMQSSFDIADAQREGRFRGELLCWRLVAGEKRFPLPRMQNRNDSARFVRLRIAHLRLRCRDKLVATMPTKKELLRTPVQHIDITQHNVVCAGGRDGLDGVQLAGHGAGGGDLRADAARYGVRRDPVPCRVADLGGPAKGVCRAGAQEHGGRDCFLGREHRGPGLLRGAGLPALHRGRRVQVRKPRRGAARAEDRPHLRHVHRRRRAADLR